MAPQEQNNPQNKPAETNIQRIMRLAKESAAKQPLAVPETPTVIQSKPQETNIQRIMREAKEKQVKIAVATGKPKAETPAEGITEPLNERISKAIDRRLKGAWASLEAEGNYDRLFDSLEGVIETERKREEAGKLREKWANRGSIARKVTLHTGIISLSRISKANKSLKAAEKAFKNTPEGKKAYEDWQNAKKTRDKAVEIENRLLTVRLIKETLENGKTDDIKRRFIGINSNEAIGKFLAENGVTESELESMTKEQQLIKAGEIANTMLSKDEQIKFPQPTPSAEQVAEKPKEMPSTPAVTEAVKEQTEQEKQAETEWLMSLTDKSKVEVDRKAEVDKFRVNLQELKYTFGKTSDGKRVSVYDEVGARVGNPDLIYLFPEKGKNYGWTSLVDVNRRLEKEIQKGESQRKQEKAEREAKIQKLISNCDKLGYTFKYGEHINNDWSTGPLIMFSDENGQNPVLDDNLGKDTCGWGSLESANSFLEDELKLSKEERQKQKDEARAEIKAEADKLQSYLQTLGYISKMSTNTYGRNLLVVRNKDGKSIKFGEDGSDRGFLSYKLANEFLKNEAKKGQTTTNPTS